MTFKPTLLALSLASAFALAAALPAAAAPLTSGIDKTSMDSKVRVQDDVFNAMNGHWLATTEIPADKAVWGSGSMIRERNDQQMHAMMDELAAAKDLTGERLKIADYYRADSDTAAMDAKGLAPVQADLRRIAALKDRKALVTLMGQWAGVVGGPLDIDFGADAKDPDLYVAGLSQARLGVPDRDYLLQDDARFVKAREAYLAYVQALLTLSGDKQAAAHAKDVLALETKLARAQWSRVEMRDPVKTYNPMKLADLVKLAPGADWAAWLHAAQLRPDAPLVVAEPSFVTALATMIKSEPLDTWKAYMKVRRLDGFAAVGPAAFRDARFAYRGKTLAGLQQERARWQIAVGDTSAALGEAVGHLYVDRHFPPEAKARMQALVGNLMKAYAQSIDNLTWMSPATKAAARDKLSKYSLKVGYPDAWRDYGKLEVKAGDALGNRDRAAAFEYARQVVRTGGKVDRTEWGMTPQTVNAYYNPSGNEIVFPAGILQPPMFDLAADDAVNYGAIGAVIGHEISHGFDDEGSQFDGDGRLRDWFTPEDKAAFKAITQRLVAQYDGYEPIPGKHINGSLTLGENIADLSGLQVSFKAYKLSLGGQPSPVIDGLTGEQRFFLGYSQAWRQKMREAAALAQLTSDPHSPGRFRATGASINADGFHEAFGTKPGDGMWKAPEDRIRLW